MHRKINWEEQWSYHAPGFRKGVAHIPLPSHQEMELLPGPGFGDCSHPTTQLMLDIMDPLLYNQVVLDIGCGSGILSIAAAKMGSSKIYCVDIDPDALEHTKKNAQHNQVSLSSQIPHPFPQKPVVLMNMILSEQECAWSHHQCPFHFLITSGILTSQKDSYLNFAQKNGWQLVKGQEKQGWLGFLFKETHEK